MYQSACRRMEGESHNIKIPVFADFVMLRNTFLLATSVHLAASTSVQDPIVLCSYAPHICLVANGIIVMTPYFGDMSSNPRCLVSQRTGQLDGSGDGSLTTSADCGRVVFLLDWTQLNVFWQDGVSAVPVQGFVLDG